MARFGLCHVYSSLVNKKSENPVLTHELFIVFSFYFVALILFTRKCSFGILKSDNGFNT